MIDFLAFTLWVLGGALVIGVALQIIGQVVIRLRHQWRMDDRIVARRDERD